MAYPSLEQYNLAFQAHSRLLTDTELQRGTVATTGLGLPLAISGGFALTYTIKSGAKKYAVRCFHRESKELEKRYSAISQRLAQLKSPYFLDFQFQPQGIRFDGSAYPIVKMAWAQGETLGEFLENNRKDKAALLSLASSLAAMGDYLEREKVAHGDLQTGNLMVSGKGKSLQLIDYDGMFVDEIKGLGSSELGHLNFQHPERKVKNPFNANLDRFSLIALTLALKALQEDSSIWDKSNSELDAIIFRSNDFIDPASSQIFATLNANISLAQDTKNFAAICKSPIDKIPSLRDFLAGRNIPLITINITGKTPVGQTKLGYFGAYDVLSANDYNVCSKNVGNKVEVIGCITEVKEDRARNGKTYVFINFGDWKGRIFKISIWSEGLAILHKKPDQSWVGKWVSVVGLMEPPYTSKKYKYTHLSITITANGQISFLTQTEAEWRLSGQSKTSKPKSPNNSETLVRIKSDSTSSTSRSVATQPTSNNPRSVSGNQQIINKIKSTQSMPPQYTQTTTPRKHATSSKNCFIATAIYGSDAYETNVLRIWRDQCLLPSSIGRVAVRFYYAISPYFVPFLNHNKIAASFTRWVLDKIIYWIGIDK